LYKLFFTEKQIWRHHNNDAERKKDQEMREKEKAQKANIGGIDYSKEKMHWLAELGIDRHFS
jgi:hypothetical protein